ncbi:MAG: hypothetical protein KDI98_00210, partial [Hyphomicrobiaceae bacterium]|nr:hypothetical protein [Hyphomicrobiaceae bacterium]
MTTTPPADSSVSYDFSDYDTNHDGSLSLSEARAMFEELGQFDDMNTVDRARKLADFFKSEDADDSGGIEEDEAQSYLDELNPNRADKFDADNNGKIDEAEAEAMGRALGLIAEDATEAEVAETVADILKVADGNSDGEVCVDEAQAWIDAGAKLEDPDDASSFDADGNGELDEAEAEALGRARGLIAEDATEAEVADKVA